MMRNLLAISFLLSLLIFWGCPDADDIVDSTLTIVNNSDKDILSYLEYRNPTDTVLPLYSLFPTKENIQIDLISSGSSESYPGSWKKLFNTLDGKVLMLFLFSRDTVEQVPWNQIRDKYLVLIRHDLTPDILGHKKWTIEYP